VKDYTVFLEHVFRGPMDLLLHLVREQEVEIHEIEITQVIQGYMAYLEALTDLDIEVAGEFAVMAATLMAIKSRSLLPRDEIDLEDELDPQDELIQRLLEYRRFKEASDNLARGLEQRRQLHPRGAFPELANEERAADEPVLELGELSVWDLLATFSRLMREILANQTVHIAGDPRPMRFYVSTLARSIQRAGRLSLSELVQSLDGPLTRETLVGAFCALLELIKIGIVTADQGRRHGEIDVVLAESAEGDVDSLLDGTIFEDEIDPKMLESEEPQPPGRGEQLELPLEDAASAPSPEPPAGL
jgi:segregation and condensation protein A